MAWTALRMLSLLLAVTLGASAFLSGGHAHAAPAGHSGQLAHVHTSDHGSGQPPAAPCGECEEPGAELDGCCISAPTCSLCVPVPAAMFPENPYGGIGAASRTPAVLPYAAGLPPRPPMDQASA